LRGTDAGEALAGGLIAAGLGPRQPAGVVIDDDRQMLVAAPVRDLVDPDLFEPVEGITQLAGVGGNVPTSRASMSLGDHYRRNAMAHETIDGVPIWYEEHGDPAGPPLVALHGGINTFGRSFGDVLPWLSEGRRVIGVELQGHGHTPDTGRAMSIDRFADDVAELIGRVAGGGPVDVWGFSLGALTATSLALRHPSTVRRLVLAASNIRADGYHPEITAPEQSDPRLPNGQEFATWQTDYEAVAPNPADFFPFLERMQPVVHEFAYWSDDEIRSITAPTFLVIGDQDFVRLEHAAEMLDLFPSCRLAVLPATRHTEVMQRSDALRALVGPFLNG
jgi:pimeloyl-ACP methyl ester carboxylesterase